MSDAELGLMQRIHSSLGDSITAAVSSTAIPANFIASLIANETGGDATKKRFESGVLGKLWEVLLGRRSRYGAITISILEDYISGLTPVRGPKVFPADVFTRLDELATSWGLTQIMGYHLLEWTEIPGWYRTIADLRAPEGNLKCAVLLLTNFADQFRLDLSKDFEALMRCWNSGRPDGQTFDPQYVANGLGRMDVYGSIEA